ncbi:MAG: hypothetical protein RTU92_03685 [Candidatus Thorarchaeota archaeon]
MGKEKIIGALIFLFALILLLYYTWGLILLQAFPDLATWVDTTFAGSDILRSLFHPDPMFLVVLPVWLASVLIAVIAMWIGWTMVTTPAPEPLEDFDFDEEKVAEE